VLEPGDCNTEFPSEAGKISIKIEKTGNESNVADIGGWGGFPSIKNGGYTSGFSRRAATIAANAAP